MSDIINKSLTKVYEINEFSYGIYGTTFLYNDWMNYIMFFVLLGVVIYWYIHVQISLARLNWDDLKCDPKIMYFSGFIQGDNNGSGYEKTLENYNDCINKGYFSATNELQQEMEFNHNLNRKNLYTGKKFYDKVFETNKNERLKLSDDIVGISYEAITNNSAYSYNYIRNLGIYVDQLDGLIDFVKQYAKNYLSYLYLYYLNKNNTSTGGSEQQLQQVKNILDTHFGGPTFFPAQSSDDTS